MRHSIRYGRGSLTLDVPPRRLVGVLRPKEVAAVKDLDAAVRTALRKPHRSEPLARILDGKRSALLMTVDNTRPSPTPMLLPIVELCEQRGIQPTVIIATGRHRQMTPKELLAHLGRPILGRCNVVQHDPFDARQMVRKGTTRRGTAIRVNKIIFRHDVVIGVGILEPSYLCGWSGGRKLLLPGLAHHESIDNNHYYLTHKDTRIGRLHGNPLSDDSAEFMRKLPYHFILYTVSGPNDEAASIVAGDPVAAHELGCKRAERIYRVKTKRADIVVSSAGGAPYDCDLVQGKKAIIPAIDAVNRNGVILLAAECAGGLGAEETFIRWLRDKTPLQVTQDVLDRKQFNLGAHGANILAKPIVEKNARVILVTRKAVADQLRGAYVTTCTRLPDAWRLANLLTGQDASVLLIEKARRLILC